jgi:hypothetical protein
MEKPYLLILILAAGCKKPYNPPAIPAPNGYLVVEGTINTGPDSTIFKLSRTVNISADTTIIPETNATVTVQSDAGLTGDAFTFWTDLKKNTEQLGSIFDPQPFTNIGNIHNVNNTSEPVVGYVSACLVQTKRIYILKAQLPQSYTTIYPYDCQEGKYYFNYLGDMQVLNSLIPLNSSIIPVTAFSISIPGGASSPGGYFGADIQCVDCTLRGTKQQPGFWK